MKQRSILIPVLLGCLSSLSISFAWAPSQTCSTCFSQKAFQSHYSRKSLSCLVQANPLDESSTHLELSPLDMDSLLLSDQQKSTLWNNFPDINEELFGKIMNAMLLVASFGFAFYTILSVDSGMTRGWTQSEIAMRIPVDNWSSYESALAESPIVTKTIINVIIYLLGDWLSQTVFAKKNVLDFDAKRTLRNGFIGLCFGPLVHMYYEWSDTILPVEAGLLNRIKKIFMDQTLYLSIKCSIYISAVGLLAGEDWDDVKQTVKDRIGPVCFTAWKFWPLVHCITYGIIPARHRILWVNCVDLVWNAILSTLSRKTEPEILEPALVTAVLYTQTEEGIQTIPAPVPEPDTTINMILLEGAGVKDQEEIVKLQEDVDVDVDLDELTNPLQFNELPQNEVSLTNGNVTETSLTLTAP